MINLFFSLVAIAASVAGIFAGQKLARVKTETPSAADLAHPANPEFVTPDILVFPVIGSGDLSGYMVTRFSLQIKNRNASRSPVGDDILLSDAFYSAAFELTGSAQPTDEVPNISELADKFLERANEEAGTARFKSALVQQFDLFDRYGLRRKNVRERQVQQDEKPKPSKNEH